MTRSRSSSQRRCSPSFPGAESSATVPWPVPRRLGVSHLDLYQVHWPNPFISDGPIMRGMRTLQGSGLIDDVGVSAYGLRRWLSAEEALGTRVLTNQVSYSLVDRSPEMDLLAFAESMGRAVIAFNPLAKGLLSGNSRQRQASHQLQGHRSDIRSAVLRACR